MTSFQSKNAIYGYVIALLFGVLGLSGCAALESIAKNADQAKLVIQVATMKVVEAGSDRHERAVKIKEIASDAKVLLDASTISVDLLAEATRVRISALNLQPSDRLLADLLIDAVVTDLKSKVGEGSINPEQRLRVNTVLSWIEGAAAFY